MKKRVFLGLAAVLSIGTGWLVAQPAGDPLLEGGTAGIAYGR